MATDRRDALTKRICELVPEWWIGLIVQALRCFYGLDVVSAATFIASVGDLARFDSPRQLMAYLGLKRLTILPKTEFAAATGNREARRMIVEASWSYRYPARAGWG